MRVLHAGHFQLGSVHGTHQALWQLARAQANAGHAVTILNVGWDPPESDVHEARASRVSLRGLPAPRWGRFWADESGRLGPLFDELEPDVLHLQYVRIPRFVAIERMARRRGLPHVHSVHGGYKATEMQRHRARKLVYWRLLEKAIHRRAGGIHFISERERAEYEAHFLPRRPTHEVIANILIPPPRLPERTAALRAGGPTFASFGRYDIWNKGLDLGCGLVRALRHRGIRAEYHLYGSAAGRWERAMASLKREYADIPLFDHGFVPEAEKLETMAGHDFYLQYSRFEGFGMSVVEAMTCGVPVVASEECDLAPQWAAAEAALIVPMDMEKAADLLVGCLKDPAAVARVAESGRVWARRSCDPQAVAAQMTDFYQRSIAAWRARRLEP